MCRRHLVPISSLVTIALCGLVEAGCGGGGSPGVASVRRSTTAVTTAGGLAYARCMRSNGVPGFPDPDSTGGIPKEQVLAVARGPKFDPASRACRHLMPATGLAPPSTSTQTSARVADELSFAKCMRAHGVPRFPDPTAQGGLSVASVQAHGVDVHSPAVLRVVQRCLPASHGALTERQVRNALHDAGG